MRFEEIHRIISQQVRMQQQTLQWGLAAQQAPQQQFMGVRVNSNGNIVKQPRKKVVSRILSPQEAVTAAAKAVKDAQKLLT